MLQPSTELAGREKHVPVVDAQLPLPKTAADRMPGLTFFANNPKCYKNHVVEARHSFFDVAK